MNITGVSDLSSFLPAQAVQMKSGQIQQAIQGAVLKQVLDQQQTAAQALVEMIRSTSPAVPAGRIDLRV